MSDLICNIKPDKVYHLGAQSHVGVWFDVPEYTAPAKRTYYGKTVFKDPSFLSKILRGSNNLCGKTETARAKVTTCE
jgi:hypothetical protein